MQEYFDRGEGIQFKIASILGSSSLASSVLGITRVDDYKYN